LLSQHTSVIQDNKAENSPKLDNKISWQCWWW